MKTNLRDMPHVRKLADSLAISENMTQAAALWRIDQASYNEVQEMWKKYVGFLPDDPRSNYLNHL